MHILTVDAEWLDTQVEKLTEAEGYVVGLVIIFQAHKILVGRTSDETFQAAAEYEDVDGQSKSVLRKGRTAAEAVRKCSRALHGRSVRIA